MNIKMLGLYAITISAFTTIGYLLNYKPNNYDDCVLHSLKEVENKLSVALVLQTCREKFPQVKKPEPASRILNEDEFSKLSIRTSNMGNYLSGEIYNGNKNIVVTEITLLKQEFNESDYEEFQYSEKVHAEPLKVGDFQIRTLSKKNGYDSNWKRLSAKGYEPVSKE